MADATLELGRGYVTVFDEADWPLVKQYRWRAYVHRRRYSTRVYALAHAGRVGKYRPGVYLHRVLLGLAIGDRRQVDHRDGDGLNNRRENLRIATSMDNNRNRRKRGGCSSRYTGVHFDRPRCRWLAQIVVLRMQQRLGAFATEEEAAMAYNVAAAKHFGDFARLNRVEMG